MKKDFKKMETGKRLLYPLLLLVSCLPLAVCTQPLFDYNRPFIVTSQLGFFPEGPKEVTLYGGRLTDSLPDEIPFYLIKPGIWLPRGTNGPAAWNTGKNVFRWPFHEGIEPYIPKVDEAAKTMAPYKGVLRKMKTAWGTIWRGDFSAFQRAGHYQIECLYGFTVPFLIDSTIYDRIQRGYLDFVYNQRSGMEIPGVRPMENADDARLDSDPGHYLPVAGGWNDAGDWRKWLFLTLPNLDALGQVATKGHPAFRQRALDEMEWGNRYFQHMITDEGRVYEDVGGGINRLGNYDSTWWNENHPGVTAAGDIDFDNIPMNGIERQVRTTYNPLIQFQFVRHQALASTVLSGAGRNNALVLADRAWRYGEGKPHDKRTLFVAQQLLAAVELYHAGGKSISSQRIEALVQDVLKRQEVPASGIAGYFMEKDGRDGYRSIAFSTEPAFALLRYMEAGPENRQLREQVRVALLTFGNRYLLAEAGNNAFGLPPYGVFVQPPFPELQLFRKIQTERYVRTFIHVFSKDPLPHGVNQVFLQQAYWLARAGYLLQQPEWKLAAARILNWSMGHNPAGLCLFTSVGFRHPVPASFMNYQIPNAAIIGFIGTTDDKPYVETSNQIEWSSQEIWDVPYYFAIGALSYLMRR